MKLALGTVQFGLNYGIANRTGKVPPSEADAIITAARAAGILLLDTAIAYGDSEACLGEIGVAGMDIVSKLPAIPPECIDVAAWVQEQAVGALRRLNVDTLYGFLVHDSRQLLGTKGGQLISGLQLLRSNGLVKKIGVSIYAPDELVRIFTMFKPDLIQAPLNIIDRRLVVSGWLKKIAGHGVEVHTRSAFLQGLLMLPELPDQFSKWKNLWEKWREWLKDNPGKGVAACLAYPLLQSGVSRVVVGVENMNQLNQLLMAMNCLPSLVDIPDLECSDEFLINPSNWFRH